MLGPSSDPEAMSPEAHVASPFFTASAQGLAQQMPSLLLERGFVELSVGAGSGLLCRILQHKCYLRRCHDKVTTHVILPARGRAGILSAVKHLEDCCMGLRQ